MIIKSIEISNFLSYHGTTKLKFDEGATLIIGQNNTGKSKLFDAYNWVLYNEAYETESEDWAKTNELKDTIANRLAKKECAVGSKVEISVYLVFEDEEFHSYTIYRGYRIEKVSESQWDCPNDSELAINKVEAATRNSFNYDNFQSNDLLSQFFPRNLSRYFLFQGEGISRLLRLNQRSDFTKAIGELSGIKYFDKARRYAESVFQRAKHEFENKADSDATVQLEKTRITKDITEIKDKLASINAKLDNEYRERDLKKTKLEEKEALLSKFEECAKLLQEIKLLERDRDAKVGERKRLYESRRSDVFSNWIYGPVNNLFVNFLILYRQAKDDKKIPEPIRQDFILEMLQSETCKVCGTIAKNGSEQYDHIHTFLNDKSLDKEISVINRLSDTADTMNMRMNVLGADIDVFREELRALQGEINSYRNRIISKDDELRVVTERITEKTKETIRKSDIEKINLVQLKKDRDQIREDMDDSKGKIDQLLGRKEETEKALAKVEQEFKGLVERSTNEHERERMKLAQEIRDQLVLLHNNFLTKLISDIEFEANNYFDSMTKTNTALSGQVKVDYDSREVYTVDENGLRMTNINQANKVSLQISFVAAVLSVSNKIWEKHFPFVADAPISALGGNNKISSIKTIIDIFRQSIIILKDDAQTDIPESVNTDQVRQLIRVNDKITNAYELKMKETAGVITEQNSEVVKLK
jgi:DNA sulfur modification protein DndD